MTHSLSVSRTVRILAIAIAIALPGVFNAAAAASFAVVVNSDNALSGDQAAMMAQVSRIFLKSSKSWPGGEEAAPLSAKAGDPAYQALLEKVLGMSQSEYDQHWARLKQTTGDTPPREVGSTGILFRLIAKKAGAVSVVSAEEAAGLPEGVKILFTFDH